MKLLFNLLLAGFCCFSIFNECKYQLHINYLDSGYVLLVHILGNHDVILFLVTGFTLAIEDELVDGEDESVDIDNEEVPQEAVLGTEESETADVKDTGSVNADIFLLFTKPTFPSTTNIGSYDPIFLVISGYMITISSYVFEIPETCHPDNPTHHCDPALRRKSSSVPNSTSKQILVP